MEEFFFEVYATADPLVFRLDEPMETNSVELDNEIFRMCDNIYLPLFYGGSDSYRSFRATNPMGLFKEGERVEETSWGGREELVKDGFCYTFRFFTSVGVTISASDEIDAQKFLEANFTNCFQILDDEMLRKGVSYIPAQIFEFRRY